MTTEIAFKQRVQAGSAWLDVNYPDWWKTIDLVGLDLASCRHCVLGQVWSGQIPVGERKQLVAQVVQASMWASDWHGVDLGNMAERVDGYTYLRRAHKLTSTQTTEMGFALSGDEAPMGFDRSRVAWETLRDEWVRVIIGRRLASEPRLVEELKPVKVLVNA
jgi:hypothetical protein